MTLSRVRIARTRAALLAVGGIAAISAAASADDVAATAIAAVEPGPPGARIERPAPRPDAEGEAPGWRRRLEAAGIRLDAAWYGDLTRTLAGGLRSRDTTHRTFLDADLTLESQPLLGLPGGKLRCEIWRIGGDARRDGSGAIQDPSGLTAERRFELGQLWYEQVMESPALRVRAGKIDPTYDFAVVEGGWDFLNSGVTYPPNLVGVPVYPDTAFGVELGWDPDPSTRVLLGGFDGALQEGVETGRRGPSTLLGPPADLCMLAEVRRRWLLGSDELPGTAVLGGWHHTGTFTTLDGVPRDGTGGAYAVIEQQFERESADPECTQGLSAFARTTLADGDVSDAARHDGLGLVRRGLIPGRDDDVTGLGVLRVQPAGGVPRRPESVIELFHKFQLSAALSITPDLQYVRHPWGAPRGGGALVAGLRLTVVF